MKVGIWGGGGIATTHVAALGRIGAEVVCVVESSDRRAEEFANQHGIPHHGADPRLFIEQGVTTVHVCTPPALHYEMVRWLLERGIHVLCEKPLCTDVVQAEELWKLAETKKLRCGVNFNVRYHPACQAMHTLIQDKGFGRVLLLHGSYLQQFHVLPVQYGWRYDSAIGGTMRAVTEIGTHWMDLAQWLTGQTIKSVCATLDTCTPNCVVRDGQIYPAESGEGTPLEVTSEDTALIQLKLGDGTIASVVLSEVSHGRMNRLSMEVTGINQSVWWNSEESTTLHVADPAGETIQRFPFGENGFTDTFFALIKDFYSPHPTVPTLQEGAHLVAVCSAIENSRGNWIDI